MSHNLDYMDIARKVAEQAGVRTWEYRKGMDAEDARSYVGRKKIMAVPPTNLRELSILAHEAGHVATTPVGERKGNPELEFLATEWAIKELRQYGVEPDIANMKDALWTYVRGAEGRGFEVSQRVRDWLEGKVDV